MTDSDRILEIIQAFPPLKERVPAFQRPDAIKGDGEKSYEWLINEWIPGQPDRDVLMELSILLGFRFELVVAALMGEDKFSEQLRNMAERCGIAV